MKIIFGTTNEVKKRDLNQVINELNLDIQVLSLNDINWDLGEIPEDGLTISDNSLIKANAILDFCKEHNINYPILTDDAGLFIEALNGEPGVYTARYAEPELLLDPTLPKYYSVYKVLNKLKDKSNRNAYYECCVTIMNTNGNYEQFFGRSNGTIANEIIGEIKKPFLYSIFILNGYSKAFNQLTNEELNGTYRNQALKKAFNSMK